MTILLIYVGHKNNYIYMWSERKIDYFFRMFKIYVYNYVYVNVNN